MQAVFTRPTTTPRPTAIAIALPAVLTVLAVLIASPPAAADDAVNDEPLHTLVDLDVGESTQVELSDGTAVELTLVAIDDERDATPQNAVRRATATVEINGERVTLESGKYHLPVEAGGVQIDVPVTAAYANSRRNVWNLHADARLRLWPADSPWVRPGTFTYPVRQRLFATDTQAGNVPTFVDGGERPTRENIYYHEGFDVGGYEGRTEVVSATDGVVVSIGGETIDEDAHPPVRLTRYDVLYIRDDRGWYYRYSHMKSFETRLELGERVSQGDKIGDIGKEGGSGGWAHLHFDISVPLPGGGYGIVEALPYLFDAYRRQHEPAVVAIARPHHVVYAGETVALDGRRSWARDGIAEYQWTLTDGSTHTGPTAEARFDQPGTYSETLRVTDADGHVDYDFTVVQVLDRDEDTRVPPTIHAAHHPTRGIKAGDPVHFAVRCFRLAYEEGHEVWDFGDGSEPVTTRSRPVPDQSRHHPDGYARTVHRFDEPGNYIVTVQRTNDDGQTATARLHVHVKPRQSR